MVLHHFHHSTGHITMGSLKGRGNQYIQLVKVLYFKLPTNSRQLPAFPFEAGQNYDLSGGKRDCYHTAAVAPKWLLHDLYIQLHGG